VTPAAELDQTARRALRDKARHAILEALTGLGGQGHRSEVIPLAAQTGGFTELELAAPPPPKANPQYTRLVDYELSWALSKLKRDGLLENPARSIWRLVHAGPAVAGTPQPVQPPQPAIADRAEELATMPYRDYLRTPEWRQRRAEALERAGHACMMDAGHTHDLEVHHRSYERRGHELESDLIVLCRDCHRLHHAENGRPGRTRSEHRESFGPPVRLPERSAHAARPPRAPLWRRILAT
jgi:Mrr N-terminal domain